MASPLALVRNTTEWVTSQAKYVIIDDSAIQREADKLLSLPPLQSKWSDYTAHFYRDGSDLMAQYVLVLDTLNFCFWPNKALEYEHLAGPLRDVITKDEHAFDGNRLANITKEELVKWIGDFPLIDERLRLLREVGSALSAHFDGKASNLIKNAKGSAAKLVESMTAHFPGFRDHCVYKGRQIFLYKRVQIFVGDIWGAYEGKGLGKFEDIGELTMFPDYRVPQLLQHNGILKYTPTLSQRLTAHTEIVPGSEEEVEIRAASVQAVEKLRKRLAVGGREVLSIELDWMMWNKAEGELARRRTCKIISYISNTS